MPVVFNCGCGMKDDIPILTADARRESVILYLVSWCGRNISKIRLVESQVIWFMHTWWARRGRR
jgi:hypothetical protein